MEVKKVTYGVWVIAAADCCIPVDTDQLAAVLGVTRQTVLRWARGATIPRTVELALRSAVCGLLEHPAWRGWRVDQDGRLWAPNGYGFMPAELEAFQHILTTNRLLWRRIGELTDDDAGGASTASPLPLRRDRRGQSDTPSSAGRSSSGPSA